MYSLGKKLKELRVKRGLSQDELVDKLNKRFDSAINKSMVSKWENDLSEPRLETTRMLAVFFGITLDELLGINQDTDEIETIAAHHDGDEWTEEELDEIERFKEFVKSKRQQN